MNIKRSFIIIIVIIIVNAGVFMEFRLNRDWNVKIRELHNLCARIVTSFWQMNMQLLESCFIFVYRVARIPRRIRSCYYANIVDIFKTKTSFLNYYVVYLQFHANHFERGVLKPLFSLTNYLKN